MKVNELWLAVFGLLAIFIFIEALHTRYHHKAAPYCASIEAPQSRTSMLLAFGPVRRIPFSRLDGGKDHNKLIKQFS